MCCTMMMMMMMMMMLLYTRWLCGGNHKRLNEHCSTTRPLGKPRNTVEPHGRSGDLRLCLAILVQVRATVLYVIFSRACSIFDWDAACAAQQISRVAGRIARLSHTSMCMAMLTSVCTPFSLTLRIGSWRPPDGARNKTGW